MGNLPRSIGLWKITPLTRKVDARQRQARTDKKPRRFSGENPRGYRVGNAAISEKHAGFAVNLGGATAAEVRQLLEDVANIVEEKSGIRLEPEIRIW